MFVAGWRHALQSEWPFISITFSRYVQPRGLQLQTALLQLPGALTPRGSRVMGPHGLPDSQAAQLETLHNSCMRRMMGRYRADAHLPSTQPPQGQVAGARSPQARDHHRQPTAACRLHPRAPKACRPPPLHVEGWGHARPQRPRAPATPPRLAKAGSRPGAVEGGCQLVLGLSVLIDTSLLSF